MLITVWKWTVLACCRPTADEFMVSSHLKLSCCWWLEREVILWCGAGWHVLLCIHACPQYSARRRSFTSNFWAGKIIRSLTFNAASMHFHARKSEYVNNIMVTVALEAAVGHRGRAVRHYELCRSVQNAEEIQHSSVGTSRDFIPSQWHNPQPCLQS